MRWLWLVLLLPSLAAAEAAPVDVLNKIEPTRTTSIGGAGSAIGVDPTLVWINPAAAVHCDGASFTMAGQRGFFKETTGQALWAAPFRGGVFFAGALYYNAGDTRLTASTGQVHSYTVQEDFAGMVGYAGALSKAVSAGATAKWMHSEVFGRAAGSLSGDAGVQVALGRHLKLGAAIQHVGTDLTYLNHDVALPTTARVGVAVGLRPADLVAFAGSKDTLVIAADAVQPLVEEKPYWKTGVEYRWQRLIALRAGANGGGRLELAKYAAGFGFRVGLFRIDYSIRFGTAFASPQTLSLTVALHPMGAAPVPVPVAPPPLVAPVEPETTTAPPVAAETPAQAAAPPSESPAEVAPAGPREDEGGLIDDLNRQLDELIHKGSSGK